ncbi:Asparagine synthetase [glutamine-hydrolyzing] [hydrothermal vent metagenome]|uniref:Asparagine synthetase [glutamine-hydrolyzing] n=1 Tax=hydrothermal vent metagenome TaxID=652676 RepID=A0A3B1BYT3_9ZZZZ
MCGISGILNLKEPKKIKITQLKELISVLKHRGPDEVGAYIDNWAGLVHSRLSIIGIKGGVQPIHNENKSLWIIFNGEIFNYPELRETLIKLGHHFYTTTDTEVLLHLYEEKGIDFLQELNGQFAFALWDVQKKEMILGRDRVGIRPLHYTVSNNQLFFSSEIKSIFTQKSIERSIDPSVLDQIFSYWTPLPGETIFKGIKEVPPGSYLKISSGKLSLNKYWNYPYYSEDEQLDLSLSNITEEVKSLLYDSIKLRLRADVPVGAYLSGGLDSSIITYIVNNSFNNDLNTFGIRFQDKDFDEGGYQKEMVDQLKTNHLEIIAKSEEIGLHFPNVLWHIEKPILRTAPVPLYLLSNLVHNNKLKVVLTGEGADEIFGGYNIFREAKARLFWSKDPNSGKRPLLLGKLYPYIFKDPKLRSMLKSFFGVGIDNPDFSYFSHQIRWQNTRKLTNFLSNDYTLNSEQNFFDRFNNYLPEGFNRRDLLSKSQYLEITTFLSNYLLSSQGDRVAMANSVEIRFPFLDHRLIEFMAKVPSRYKIFGMNEKFLLKKSYRDVLPPNIINRSKHPYRAPIKQSLLDNNNAEIFKKYCSIDSIENTGIFDEIKTEKLFKKLTRFENPNEWDNMALTGIFSTQVIYDKFVRPTSIEANSNFKFDFLIDKRK